VSKAGHPWPVTNRVGLRIILRTSDECRTSDFIVATMRSCNYKSMNN
jgi:hypothetical protein